MNNGIICSNEQMIKLTIYHYLLTDATIITHNFIASDYTRKACDSDSNDNF